MTKILPNFSIFFRGLLTFGLVFMALHISAQSLYVGSGGEFFLNTSLEFTTSNTLVEVDNNGVFSLAAGNTWGSNQEYVNGAVEVKGTGKSLLPLGNNGIYAGVNLDHTGDATANYVNSPPDGGSNGANVDDVAEVEYWELSGTAIVTLPYGSHSEIGTLVGNNGNVLNSVSIVGLNGGVWDLISATNTSVVNGDLESGTVSSDLNVPANLNSYTQFTFGIDHQIVLGLDDLFLENGISLLANPVPAEDDSISFLAASDMVGLKVTIYDINGRKVSEQKGVDLIYGQGYLSKRGLKSGLYFILFEHEGKSGVKKILIE